VKFPWWDGGDPTGWIYIKSRKIVPLSSGYINYQEQINISNWLDIFIYLGRDGGKEGPVGAMVPPNF
jgi:hypothetical protein